MADMRKIPGHPRKRVRSGVEAFREDVASWQRVPPEGRVMERKWPVVGQRVRLVANHPRAGEVGEVIDFELLGLFPEVGKVPLLKMDKGGMTYLKDRLQWEPID
jgi:hypothetical protein